MSARRAPGVYTEHGQVITVATPEDAHSEACFYHGLIPWGDSAAGDALVVIRAAHQSGVCPPRDGCPIPLPEDRRR